MSDRVQSQTVIYRTECGHDECGWDYEHEKPHFVKSAAENHEKVYRNHDWDHSTTDLERVEQ